MLLFSDIKLSNPAAAICHFEKVVNLVNELGDQYYSSSSSDVNYKLKAIQVNYTTLVLSVVLEHTRFECSFRILLF